MSGVSTVKSLSPVPLYTVYSSGEKEKSPGTASAQEYRVRLHLFGDKANKLFGILLPKRFIPFLQFMSVSKHSFISV